MEEEEELRVCLSVAVAKVRYTQYVYVTIALVDDGQPTRIIFI